MDKIKKVFLPEVDPEVQTNMNAESITNIRRLSVAAMIFMALSLAAFVPTLDKIDGEAVYRIGKFVFGFIICLCGFLIAGRMQKTERPSNGSVTLFMIAYFVFLILWAIFISYREYIRGEQLLIFYATELLLVCFLPLRPLIATLLSLAEYTALYAMLYSIDGAKGILLRNYAVLIAVSITGMIVVYHSRVRMSEREVGLKKSFDLLDYTARHDALTGLCNRKALHEDVAEYTGKQITVLMMDINYFKVLNDTHGHVTGDAVLKEAGRLIKESFPGSICYRYGGDEFLAAGEDISFDGISLSFSIDSVPDETIVISVGRADGCPGTDQEFFRLVSEADEKLYEAKKLTH